MKQEYDYVRQYTLNTVYNFYHEGVVSQFVVKLGDKSKQYYSYSEWSLRAKLYTGLFSTVLIYGFY